MISQQWPMSLFNDLVTGLAHLLPRRQLSAEDQAVIASRPRTLTSDSLNSKRPPADPASTVSGTRRVE
ncbi:MAG: hypothetical protein PHD43_04975 [Methylococcales bacterium]|nr:hypothetical protein [Methylococcales bacterium]